MHVKFVGIVLAATFLALDLPGQGRGRGKARGGRAAGPAIEIQVGTDGVGTRRAPPGHSRGKAWWKTQPGLVVEIDRHQGLQAHLEANPRLSVELRMRADADGDGVLSVKERQEFVRLLEAHRRPAAKVEVVPRGEEGVGHTKPAPAKPKDKVAGSAGKKPKDRGRAAKRSRL